MQLKIGYDYDIMVRKEQYFYQDISPLKVMYLSDFHFNAFNGGLVLKIIKLINHYNPDILLLGGDYVDTKKGLQHFIRLLYTISDRKNVFAVAGNHDYFFGINTIRNLIFDNNIKWIERSSVSICVENKIIQIDGNITSCNKAPPNCLKILCLHQPIDITKVASSYNMAFAGHLHGCQIVFWQNEKGLFPGRYFYRWNILKKQIGNCHYYISKGLGDMLPVRFNCSPEVIVVNVFSKYNDYI